MRLEASCSKLILDCIDWSKDSEFKTDPVNLYDVLDQVYCAKLSIEGQPQDHED